VTAEVELRDGWVSGELREEFPELALVHVTMEARSGRSPRSVRERLGEMANRLTGPKAVQMRQEPVPWAYRVFFRQVGIDPDERRTPVEAIALERMRAGGFRSRSLLDDAMLIATVETGVPLVAFDADRVGREIGLRLSHPGEYLGGDGRSLALGQIVVADEDRSLAVLFADMAADRGVTPSTTRMVLAAIQVKGVPRVSVEEALWIASEVLSEPG
jgi:DNA/RNA-binding domain of Phe-tRNA-synthetase-like protein